MRKRILITIAVLALLIPQSALAVGLYAGESVVIDQYQGADAYGAGGQVTVSEGMGDDLMLAGGKLAIDGTVAGDALLAGGSVIVSGNVGDDLMVFGGDVIVNGRVGDDLSGGMGQLSITRNAVVNGDVVVGAGLTVIDGTVNGSVHIIGGEVRLSGTVNGDFKAVYDEQLVLLDGARITGNLYYVNDEELVVTEGVVAGEVIRTTSPFPGTDGEEPDKESPLGFLRLWHTVVILIAALAWALVCKQSLVYIGSKSFTGTFWARLGLGALVCVVTPIVAVILMVTGIGALLGGIVLMWWVLLLMVSCLFSNFLVGNLVMPIESQMSTGMLLLRFLIGAIILSLVWLIPVVGALIHIIVFIASVGALVQFDRDAFRKLRKEFMA